MRIKHLSLIILSTMVASCGSDSKDSNDPAGGGGGGGGGGGVGSVGISSAHSLSDLSLSTAFQLAIPDSVKGGSASSLVSAKRSADACNIRNEVAGSLLEISQVGNMFCHLEVESDKFSFGVKTHIEFDFGMGLTEGEGSDEYPDSFQLWVDNSSDDQLVVYFCEDGTLQDRIVLTDASEGRSAGSVTLRGSYDESTYARSLSFDNGVSEIGRTSAQLSEAHESASDSFRRFIQLNLSDTGVSEMAVSRGGSWQGNSFSDAGFARFSSDGGMAIFNGEGSHTFGGETYDYQFRTRSAFDNLDLIVDIESSSEFAEGGSLHVAASELPEILGDDFTVAEFPEGSWDCGDIEESITINPESADHQACDVDWDELSWENCWEEGEFQRGDEI